MNLNPETREFLTFLKTHPDLRLKIRAAPGQTLLYAGSVFKPMWREIEEFKRTNLSYATRETLPEVLARLPAPSAKHSNLRVYVETLVDKVPWQPDGFTIWRALSGIFAANAVGAVSFQIGSGVTDQKVFATTELAVLSRNPNVDVITKDLISYYQRCVDSGNTDIGVGFLAR
jgi:hypothetical protein